jgi:hypothetical protein
MRRWPTGSISSVFPRLARARSAREPAVYLFEDLHWLDRARDQFIENLIEISLGNRTLVLLNFRPEYHASWMQRSYYQQLPLLPLGLEAIEGILRRSARDGFVATALDRADSGCSCPAISFSTVSYGDSSRMPGRSLRTGRLEGSDDRP